MKRILLTAGVMALAATLRAAPLTVIDVGAPGINCVFSTNCTSIVTDTSSTVSTNAPLRKRGCASRGDRRTASSSRSPRFPAIRGFSPCSSTPSSSRSRRARIRCLRASSKRRIGTKRRTSGRTVLDHLQPAVPWRPQRPASRKAE